MDKRLATQLGRLLFAQPHSTEPFQERTRRARRPRRGDYAPAGGPPGYHLADLLFLESEARVNRGYGIILTVLDVNSRYLYARSLKRKTDAAAAMVEIVDEAARRGLPITSLLTDQGTEFTSRAFQKAIGVIQHITAEAGEHARISRLDRAHRTLREMVQRWFLLSGQSNWVDHLELILDAYNQHENQAIDMAPAEVSLKDEAKLSEEDQDRAQQVGARVSRMGLLPGTKVRYIINRVAFEKGTAPRWSAQPHEIQRRAGPNTFELKGVKGIFKHFQLQKSHSEDITEDRGEMQRASLRADRRLHRRVRAEGIDVAEQPQAPRQLRSDDVRSRLRSAKRVAA